MQFILILRELADHESNRVLSLSSHDNVQVIASKEFVGKHPGSREYIKLGEEEKKQINAQVFSSILDFGDREIGGESISQQLNFSGAGLWYYHKFRVFFNVRKLQYLLAEISKNLEGSSSAIIYASENLNPKTRQDLENVEFIPPEKKSQQRIDFWSLLQYGFTASSRLLKSIFTSNTKFDQKKYLCIDTVSQYRNMLSLDGKSIVFENVFTGYLYQKKGDQIGFIDQLLIPKFKGKDRYRFNVNHIKNNNNRDRTLGENIITKALLSIRIWRRLIRSRKELHRKYSIIEQSLGDDQVQTQFLSEFRKLETTTLFYLLKYFAYLNFFKNRKVSSILSVDENSANFKIILDAAKQFGIKTLGYQHGNISRFSPNYMYSHVDLLNKPMPDLTITWGIKWRDLLQKSGNYSSDSLVLAGQIRTDVIKSLKEDEALNRQAIVEHIREKHIVLFATQPQKDESLRYKAAEDAVIACMNLDSVHLIFKVHPREYDLELYTNIASKYKFKRFSIVQDKELYLLLKISDVVITCFSTVGTEALYFDKPLIILDHLKEDILEYHKDGVAFQATNSDELQYFIAGVLGKDLCPNLKNIADYLLQSTYKIDGMVADRVWDYLSESANELLGTK